MNTQKPFKTTVKDALITNSQVYFQSFIQYEYLIYSQKLTKQNFYTITAKKDNFLHLTGVKTSLNASDFFDKCFNGTLQECDFDLGDLSSRGSIRRKIKSLPTACNIFKQNNILIEERFVKNQISCSFATANNDCTLGFCLTRNSKPLTLLKGNQLKQPHSIDLIMRKSITEQEFHVIFTTLNEEDLKKVIEMTK